MILPINNNNKAYIDCRNSDRDGFNVCGNLEPKCQNLFHLVSDQVESDSAKSQTKGNEILLSLRLWRIKFPLV
jgi:hypothetical protein